MKVAENTVAKQRGRPFKPGHSGNPAGKPKGTRHKATLAMEAPLDGEVERLTRKAVEMALAGDTTALRLCLDRIAPVRRDRPVTFDLPELRRPISVRVPACRRARKKPMADFAKRWRTWLEWAGLRESEPDERVRLP